MAYGCLAFCPLIAFHSKKPYRNDAASPPIGVVEGRQITDGFALGVDRLAAAFWVLAPIGNETPTQRVERHDASFMIASDHQQILAGSCVPPWRIVVHAAVAYVHAIENGVA